MMQQNSPEAASSASDAATESHLRNFASLSNTAAGGGVHPILPNDAAAHIAAQSLLQLPEELQKIVDKPAFDLARLISPRYVEQDSFLLRFLIADNFDAKAAAARMVRHFQKKNELYGREKLGSSIQLRDLGIEDQIALASGGVQLLQAKDREGRPILLTCFSKMKYKEASNMARALWFVIMTALEMRLVQKEGLVWVSFQMNDSAGALQSDAHTMDHEVLKALASCAESLPVRLNSLHLCSDAIDRLMAPAIMLESIAKSNKIQMNFHHGAAEICMQKLSLFGIPESAFDVLRAPDERADAAASTLLPIKQDDSDQQDVVTGSNEGDSRKRANSSSFDEHGDQPAKWMKAAKVAEENELLLRGGGGVVPTQVPSTHPSPTRSLPVSDLTNPAQSTVSFSLSEQKLLRQQAALQPFHRGPSEDPNQSSLAALVSLQQHQQHQLSASPRQMVPTNAGDMRLPSSSSGGLLFGGGTQGNNGSHLSTSAVPPYMWASSGGVAQPHNSGNSRSDPSLNIIQSFLASINPSERQPSQHPPLASLTRNAGNLPSSNLSQSASLEGLLGNARPGQQSASSFFERAHQQYVPGEARLPSLPANAINQLLGPNASLNRYDTSGQDMNSFIRQQLLSQNLASNHQDRRFLPQMMQEAKSQPDAILPVLLYAKSDDVTLSPYQCLVRQQMELFEASEDDVQFNISKMSKAIAVGQVGLRCRHCAVLPPFARPKAAVYYPRTLDSLYQFGQNMVKNHHCGSCMKIDEVTKQKLLHLQEERRRGKGGRERWAEAARTMGVVEGQRGLRFTR